MLSQVEVRQYDRNRVFAASVSPTESGTAPTRETSGNLWLGGNPPLQNLACAVKLPTMQKTDARHSAAAGESKLHFLDYWRVIRVRFGIVLLSFLLVVITAAITTYFQPRKYRASVTLELRMAKRAIIRFHANERWRAGRTRVSS